MLWITRPTVENTLSAKLVFKKIKGLEHPNYWKCLYQVIGSPENKNKSELKWHTNKKIYETTKLSTIFIKKCHSYCPENFEMQKMSPSNVSRLDSKCVEIFSFVIEYDTLWSQWNISSTECFPDNYVVFHLYVKSVLSFKLLKCHF